MEVGTFRRVREILRDGAGKTFSGATLLVARRGQVILEEFVGYTAFPGYGVEPHPVTMDTVFDLASLTKPLVVAPITMRMVSSGCLRLDTPLGQLLHVASRSWLGDVPIIYLLSHTSGLPAWRPYGAQLVQTFSLSVAGSRRARVEMMRLLLKEQKEYETGTAEVYSDLGYILLGLALEHAYKAKLDVLFGRLVTNPLRLQRAFFVRISNGIPRSPRVSASDVAATEFCPTRKRMLHCEVHDENAFVLGGVAGHAGLFASARDVWKILDAMMDPCSKFFDYGVFRSFLARPLSISSRTVAFDTPSQGNSSAGSKYPDGLVGHLGFTGTSFWLQPEARIAVVLLTNRVHPSRNNENIRDFRREIHDAIWESVI